MSSTGAGDAPAQPPDQATAPDVSGLRNPLQLGSIGIKQLLQCYQVGTDEIRDTLMQECDIIVECRVCRSLYRGLPNFLAHKRHYCKKNYSGTLLRFQDLTSKEDEVHIIGSSLFSPQKSSRDMYNNIATVSENIDRVRSTGRTIELDFLDETKSAVSQSMGTAGEDEWYDDDNDDDDDDDYEPQPRKRKAETQLEHPAKFARVEHSGKLDAKEKLLDGIPVQQNSQKVFTLKQFFVLHKLKPEGRNRCLKCKQDFSTIKTLRSHLNRRHLQRRMFHYCKKCHKVFLLKQTFIDHLTEHHSLPVAAAKTNANLPKVEKMVIDNKAVCHIPTGGIKANSSIQRVTEEDTKSPEMEKTISPPKIKPKPVVADCSSQQAQSVTDEIEEDLGFDGHRELNRFCLEMMRCLAILRLSNKSSKPGVRMQRYKCLKHPSIVFKLFNTVREHIVLKHCRPAFKCPICQADFTNKKGNHFVEFAKHLRDKHHVTLPNLWPMRDALQRCLLLEPKEAEDIEVAMYEWKTEPANETAIIDIPIYACPQCNREYESVKSVKRHLLEKHEVHEEMFREQYAGTIVPTKTLSGCPTCQKRCESLESVKKHLMDDHNVTEEEYARDYASSVRYLKVASIPIGKVEERERTVSETLSTAGGEKSKNENPRRGIRDRDGSEVSIFSLDDLFCPICAKSFPVMKRIIHHLQSAHGFDVDKANSYKDKIRKASLQYKERTILNVSRTSSGFMRSRDQDDSLAEESDAEEPDTYVTLHENKRKQASPSKSPVFSHVRSSSRQPAPNLVPFKSGFSLLSCPNCNKIFGKKSALVNHQEHCVAVDTPEVTDSDSESDMEVTVNKSMVMSPARRALLTPSKSKDMQCKRCKKHFKARSGLSQHVKHCTVEYDSADEDSEIDDASYQESCDDSEVEERNYLASGTTPELKCDKCKRPFKSKGGLAMHAKTCNFYVITSEESGEESQSDEESDHLDKSGSTDISSTPPKASSTPGSSSSFLRVLLRSPITCNNCSKCNKIFSSKRALEAHKDCCSIASTEDTSEAGSSVMEVKVVTPEVKFVSPGDKVMGGGETVTEEDGENGSGEPKTFHKVYKCPLCDEEDLELHKISHHLVVAHDWSRAKVAARRDTLKRSIVLKSSLSLEQMKSQAPESQHLEQSTRPKDPRDGIDSVDRAGSVLDSEDTDANVSPLKLGEHACSMCPKVYQEMWKLKYHWQVAHGIDKDKSIEMKREMEDEKKRQLQQLHNQRVVLRSARRPRLNTGSDMSDTPDSTPTTPIKGLPRKQTPPKHSPVTG